MSILETNFYKGEQGPQGPQGPEGPEGPAGGQDVQHDDTLSGNGSPENPLKALPSCAICEMTENDVGTSGYDKFVKALGDGKLICYWDNSVGWLICSDYDITVPDGYAHFTGMHRTGYNQACKPVTKTAVFTSTGGGSLVWADTSYNYGLNEIRLPFTRGNRSYDVVGRVKKSSLFYSRLAIEFCVGSFYRDADNQHKYIATLTAYGNTFSLNVWCVNGKFGTNCSLYVLEPLVDDGYYYLLIRRESYCSDVIIRLVNEGDAQSLIDDARNFYHSYSSSDSPEGNLTGGTYYNIPITPI